MFFPLCPQIKKQGVALFFCLLGRIELHRRGREDWVSSRVGNYSNDPEGAPVLKERSDEFERSGFSPGPLCDRKRWYLSPGFRSYSVDKGVILGYNQRWNE